MSKKFKRFFAGLLAFVLMFAMTAVAAPAKEAKADEEGYFMFLAMGAATDAAGSDWTAQYYGGSADDTANMTATTAMVQPGGTYDIGLVCDTEITKTWFTRPVIAVNGNEYAVDYTINSITIDGENILGTDKVDMTAGKASWAEGTGPYADALCLAGGYNEWGDKYILESPAGYTEIMYNITINSIHSADDHFMFLAIGAATDEAGSDWTAQYYGGSADDTANITATTAYVKAGGTYDIGITCTDTITKTWFNRPVVTVNGDEYSVDYTINSIKVDGTDILGTDKVNLAADEKTFWTETTGPWENALCLAGGYNEWATKYIVESPANYKEIMYNITINSLEAAAAGGTVTTVELPEEIEMFIGIGAENAAGAWDMCWANEEGNASGIETTVEKISVGETVTLKLVMPNEVTKTYWFAPTMVVSGVGELDVTVDSMKFDGEEFIQEVDFSLNPDRGEWWYEGTGNYTAEETLRLACGYNEWADKYLAEVPTGWTELEITVTLNSIAPVAPTVSNEIIYDGEFTMFLAGTAESVADAWDLTYANGSTDKGDVAGNAVTAKAGDTVTISHTYTAPVHHTWWLAPALVLPESEDGADKYLVDYTIDKVTIDGTDVTDKLDLTLKDVDSWYEGTEDHPVTRTIRLKGGYNEWGEHFIPGDLLAGHTNVEYTITINKVYGVVVEEVEGPKADLDGTYNAYIGVQTADTWAFRNAWDDAVYGKDSAENPDAFSQISIADAALGLVKKDGVITDTVLAGNGTYTVSLKDFDFTSADGAAAASALNLLFVSTDIPNSGEITLSNIKVDFDGKNVMEFSEGFTDPDSKDWYKVLFINIWNKELTNTYNMAGMIPAKDITITFDVTGFNYDKTAEAEPEVTPEPTEAPAPEVTEAPAADPTEAPTEAPEATKAPTAAPTEAPAVDTDADAEGGISPIVIVVIVVAVIAAAGAGFVVMKKKK